MTGAMIARQPAAVREVECPTCRVAASEPCVDGAGRPRYLAHLARCHAAAVSA